MKIEKEILNLILLATETAKLLSIEDIIIDKNGIRALHPDRTSLILFKQELPLPFESIGINRLNILQQRLNVIKDFNDINIDAQVDGENNVKILKFSNKNLSVSYRCANSKTISAPKNVNENFFREVSFTKDAFEMLSKANSAMKSEFFSLISNENGVSFELVDSNNDVFSYVFSTKIDIMDKEFSETFVYKYDIKEFLPILKHNPNTKVQIGEKGILKLLVNGLDVLIVPKK